MTIDHTHDAGLRSWVASANGHSEFPIQNLPLGSLLRDDGERRAAVAIGDAAVDLAALADAGLLDGEAARFVEAARGGTLNAALALGEGPRRALRRRLSGLLGEGAAERTAVEPALLDLAVWTPALPAAIGDYTDFFAGIHHAVNAGRQFRPDNPLLPNYKHVPIGYHGRASSVRVSGEPVRRPNGQAMPPGADAPSFGPCCRLDFELEMGLWIGPGNGLGEPVPIGQAGRHIAGLCLLNDWSARDVQGWEYQPLGPFLAKSFSTTISPWIVTAEALAPFRMPQAARPEGDPAPLPYLTDAADQAEGAFDIELHVSLLTPGLSSAGHPAHRLAVSNARHLYWTGAQLVAHHTSGGCNLKPGDLLGTGTISTPDPSGLGSLLEITNGGREPVRLASGEERRFLEDGDEVIFAGRCRREGFAAIGFGECRARIVGAHA